MNVRAFAGLVELLTLWRSNQQVCNCTHKLLLELAAHKLHPEHDFVLSEKARHVRDRLNRHEFKSRTLSSFGT